MTPIAFDEALCQRLPLPLAQLYRRAHQAQTAAERHATAFWLWEAALKLLATAAIAEFLRRPNPDPRLMEMLKGLARPAVGHWWDFARQLVTALAEAGDLGYVAVRDVLLGGVRDDLPAAAQLGCSLRELLGLAAPATNSVRLNELFDLLVIYRNHFFHAGGSPSEKSADALLAGVAEILTRLDVLAGRRLLYLGDVQTGGGRELIGEDARPLEPRDLSSRPTSDRIYLELPGGAGLVTLHPLVIYDLATDDLLFFRAHRGRQCVEYLSYRTGKTNEKEIEKGTLLVLALTGEKAPALPESVESGRQESIIGQRAVLPDEESAVQPASQDVAPTRPSPAKKAMLAKQVLEEINAGGRVSKKAQLAMEDAARRADDNVQFTVYRPRTIEPERWHPLLAFAHLDELPPDAPRDEPDPVAEVKRQAEQVLGKQAAFYQPVTQDSKLAVPRKREITFVPDVPGIQFNPPRRSFLWLESVHREEFKLRAGPEMDGMAAKGTLSVFLGNILLAELTLSFRVRRGEPEERTAEPIKPYRKIFASYAHDDLPIVQEFERYVGQLGDSYLRDWVHLRAGEVWNDRLMQMIAEADVFQLFWSWNALRSEFVRREWTFALSLNRPHFIRPTYWEDPLPQEPERGMPPEELLRLHFQRLPGADAGRAAAAPLADRETDSCTLEDERRQLREQEEALMQQMREMELRLARQRAELARQRSELQRLSSEVRHDLELAQRQVPAWVSDLARRVEARSKTSEPVTGHPAESAESPAQPPAPTAPIDGADERRRLEDERRQLREDEEVMKAQLGEMELQLTRERAELSRRRNDLQQLRSEVHHELELAQRDTAIHERLRMLPGRRPLTPGDSRPTVRPNAGGGATPAPSRSVPPATAPSAAEPGRLQMRCDSCQGTLAFKKEQTGAMARCPYCGGVVRVPGSPEYSAPGMPQQAPMQSAPSPSTAPSGLVLSSARPDMLSDLRYLLITAVVAAIAGLVLFLLIWWLL